MDLVILTGHSDWPLGKTERKYLALAMEDESNNVTIVTGALSAVTKGLVQGLEDQEIRGRVETIQITPWLRSARIQRCVLET